MNIFFQNYQICVYDVHIHNKKALPMAKRRERVPTINKMILTSISEREFCEGIIRKDIEIASNVTVEREV